MTIEQGLLQPNSKSFKCLWREIEKAIIPAMKSSLKHTQIFVGGFHNNDFMHYPAPYSNPNHPN